MRLRPMIVAAVVVASLAAAACRPEEQNRRTGFTAGVYSGETLPKLTEAQTKTLGERGKLQQ